MAAWQATRRGESLLALTAVAMIALFCSPVSWSHHWVTALPLLVVLAGRRGAWRWCLLVTGVAIFALTPHWWPPHGNGQEQLWTPTQHLLGTLYLGWAAVAVLALTLAPAGPAPRGSDTATELRIPAAAGT